MADNGNSSLFAMDGDQMNLEDKVLSVRISHRRCQLYGEQIFRQARTPFFRAPSMSDHLRASNGELPGGVWPEKPSDGQVSTHLKRSREKGERV